MTRMQKAAHFSRRSALKAGGALVVSIGMPIGLDTVLRIGDASNRAETCKKIMEESSVDVQAGVGKGSLIGSLAVRRVSIG